jgi:hypothetical protein
MLIKSFGFFQKWNPLTLSRSRNFSSNPLILSRNFSSQRQTSSKISKKKVESSQKEELKVKENQGQAQLLPLSHHQPVLLSEVLDYLCPTKISGNYLDLTFGDGGHSRGILEASNKNKVFAMDRDQTLTPVVERFKSEFGSRFSFKFGRFGQDLSKKTFPE